jgi:hypothetical protein
MIAVYLFFIAAFLCLCLAVYHMIQGTKPISDKTRNK